MVKKKIADEVVKKYHYSKSVCNNSQLSFIVKYKGFIEGAIQFGPSIDSRRVSSSLGLDFGETIEINRMALSDNLPKNSESRVIGFCIRFIKKNYPKIKAIISFADACQCGDGTIYRASGFVLNSIKKNDTMRLLPNGKIVANLNFKLKKDLRFDGYLLSDTVPLDGYQLRYVYKIDKNMKIKEIPFNSIPEDVRMKKGIKLSR